MLRIMNIDVGTLVLTEDLVHLYVKKIIVERSGGARGDAR